MNQSLKVAVVQMCSSTSVDENVATVINEIRKAHLHQCDWVVLPEYFPLMPKCESDKLEIIETFREGPIQRQLSALAKECGMWIFAGSMPIQSENEKRPYGRMVVIDSNGVFQKPYDKIHLFDVTVEDATGSYLESNGTTPGTEPVICETPWGRVGFAICYDMRFPELFRYYQSLDVDFLVIPAAFTRKTGEAHWEVLLRARAIENQCFVVASAQGGIHENGRETYGHSLCIDPWGVVIDQLDNAPDVLYCTLDTSVLQSIRQQMPVKSHRKL